MCLGGGGSPAPPPPPTPPAEVKQPETVQAVRDKRRAQAGAGMQGGTLLTGASGVPTSSLDVQKPSLLGM